MRIAIVSLFRRFGGTTGDMVQAQKTADALCAEGVDVLRCYVDCNGTLFDEIGEECGSWGDTLNEYDIVHVMPPIAGKNLVAFPRIKAKLAVSTVFWRSWTFMRQLHKVRGKFNSFIIKEYIRCVLAWLGIKSYSSFEVYDLLLPNSEDEIRTFDKFCRRKKGSVIRAVPNAIDPIPDFVDTLEIPVDVKDFVGGYVLVPGVFADRKNQISLVHAMRNSKIPIVFMGNGEFLERCKSDGGENMRFVPFQKHGSESFYAYFKYAKVVCLPSNCETPGIAGLEGAALGARPVVPYEGGTTEYYGWDAEYLNPLSEKSIRESIERAWARGKLTEEESEKYRRLTWDVCAKSTREAYEIALKGR